MNIAKILISVFKLIVFLEKRNQIPITAKIRNTERNVNDNDILVVICSATESVKESCSVRKGFTALRYLKDGNGTMPVLEIPMPDITNDAKTKIQLRIFVFSLLNFIINPDIITKIVGRRIASPAYPIMNVEVLSIIKENSINDVENVGAAHKMKLSLFFMNGNEK
tara:strand:- start:8 stop:505 length:498 start_codon:yes stop_codon:yes gene_type:complete